MLCRESVVATGQWCSVWSPVVPAEDTVTSRPTRTQCPPRLDQSQPSVLGINTRADQSRPLPHTDLLSRNRCGHWRPISSPASVQCSQVISGDGSYAPSCKLQYARTAHYEVYRLQHWISLTTLLLEKRVLLRMVILRPIVMGWENDGTVCSHYWPISIFISAVHTQAGSIYITWLPPPCLQYSPIPLTLPLHTCSLLSSGQCLNQCLMSNINFGRNSATGISCLNSTREIFQ